MSDAATRGIVVGVGSVLVDILVHEQEEFLEKAGAVKGGMRYVEKDDIDRIVAMTRSTPAFVPGGSACNTVMGVGKLGGHARFMGKSGNGALANLFETDLKNNSVEPYLFKSPSLTGRVLSIVTPDAQRSMLTFLGAAAEVSPEEVSDWCFEGSSIVHVEGYLLFNPAYLSAVLSAAKRARAKISLDLASFTVVESSRAFLNEVVDRYVDILIANEDEALAFTGLSDEEASLKKMAEHASIAVLKLGERGSMISADGVVTRVAAKGGTAAADTTGAGDLWASGFLHGLVSGYPIDVCGAIGSMCGYEVCQVMGAKIPDDGWLRIRESLANLKLEE